MGLLYRVLYAAHAKGTHHKLALDALAHLCGPDAEAWRRLFLKHADTFMVGAKAPDTVFKDFRNHVLHPREGFWGGAPAAARQWYGKTVELLSEQRWPDAVNAAGILSHYVTDAVHPFHTGQSEAENAIHRAFEWSTAKSYDDLKSMASGGAISEIVVPDGPQWLEDMLRQGAVRANQHYEKLIAHYDINRGVVDPPAGLDVVAQRILGDLILYASRLFGVILGRALAESQVAPPQVSLTFDLVLATVKIPVKQLAKRLADAEDRRIVERMYDELRETGTVERTLPEDDRMVRDLHAVEVLGRPPAAVHHAPEPEEAVAEDMPDSLSARLSAAATDRGDAGDPEAEWPREVTADPRDRRPSPEPRAIADAQKPGSPARPGPSASGSVPSIRPRTGEATPLRPRLTPSDDVVDAPSIGPRTADRLRLLGVLTVKDLLEETPAALAQALAVPGITAQTVADWQSQALMVCTVPGLSGTGAQLFVGSGYRDAAAIATAEPEKVCADLLAFAGSEKGRRILRDGEAPNVERIKRWAESARTAMAA